MNQQQIEGDWEKVERLLEQLESEDHFIRAESARQLCNLGTIANRALPRLLDLAGDPWYQVRIQVPRALIHLGASSSEAAAVLPRLINDQDETVRLYAEEAVRVLLG